MYSSGTAAGPKTVLQALATFAASAGFTVDNNAAFAGGWWLAVHKGSCYLNFVADAADTTITMYGATGFSGASAPSAQAQSSTASICNSGAGPYTGYHFFSTTGSPNYLHCVIEKTAGLFAQFHAGQLAAIGGAAPCIYLQATNWSYTGSNGSWWDGGNSFGNFMPWSGGYAGQNKIGVTVDGTFRWFQQINGGISPARTIGWPLQQGPSNLSAAVNALARSPNTFNGLSVLIPIYTWVERAAGNVYAYIGDTPDSRVLNMNNLNPKDEITIGADTWKVFPMISNSKILNTTGAPPSSNYYAMAFRKNA